MIEKHYGELSEGCKRCFRGEKLVLFVTGVCPRNCIYCPLSDEKKNRDVIFANEQEIREIDDLISEVEISGATGAGVTGGDPLSRLDRTCEFIEALKKKFGKDFHVHLYTSLDLLDEEKIARLVSCGLDELRVHPEIEDKKLWRKLELLKDLEIETVVEIPAIPRKEKEILELVKFAKDYVKAFNLNEMELAQTKIGEFAKMKWKTDKDSVTIKGSERTAMNVLKKARGWSVRIHYCSARFKDEIQFCERMKKYAKNVALPCDKISDSGTLIRGVIYSPDIEELRERFPKEEFFEENGKIICSVGFVRTYCKEIGKCAVVEEYPTRDRTEIYVEML